jgi:hypothetical protein
MTQEEKITTKPGLEKEWNKTVNKNQDSYGHAVVEMTVKLCKALDEDNSPEEAEEIAIKDSDITGFMAGCMAQWVSYFHPRGEEFRKHWNKKVGGVTGQENSEGVLNPALISIKNQ